jgi:predicted nucleic acid-binding protein
VTEADERKAIALVRQHQDKTHSLCDAQTFVVMRRLGSRDAIAADDHFRHYGLNTLL